MMDGNNAITRCYEKGAWPEWMMIRGMDGIKGILLRKGQFGAYLGYDRLLH
ncbi:hypothetical protein SOASR014_40110 [Pectobacterium carotovorum subsp. carotovorum]|jgi:hypothetical protein|nr:hypothetical protein SOASR014_40110 [Pectobacterium carotovorum subsp. carotovorum]GLX46476.1 hypothetical protein Pcaca01_41440 [Pectobacterium carotovorum subsp. carotovorum]